MLHKIIGFLYFSILRVLFKKSGNFNQISPSTKFLNIHNITIGSYNKFNKNSKLSAEGDCSFTVIGDKNIFDYNSIINSHHGHVYIGNNNYFGPNTILQGFGGLEIGNDCMIAGNTFVSSSNHDFSNPQSEEYLKIEIGKKVIIENKVWIGANCTITAGVKIGKYSVIAAGSVVTKDIPQYSIAAGVPARIIKRYDFSIKCWKRIN